jgi:hypothetical protein
MLSAARAAHSQGEVTVIHDDILRATVSVHNNIDAASSTSRRCLAEYPPLCVEAADCRKFQKFRDEAVRDHVACP